MKSVLQLAAIRLVCRRTIVALAGIASLTYLGLHGHDVSVAIASIAIGLSAANAYQQSKVTTNE